MVRLERRMRSYFAVVSNMLNLNLAIYTGVPKSRCGSIEKLLVETKNASKLENCIPQNNCLLYSYNRTTIRVTKNGFIKVFLAQPNLGLLDTDKKLLDFFEEVLRNISVLFKPSCISSYDFTTNNLHFSGKFACDQKNLIQHCLQKFPTAKLLIGQIDSGGSGLSYSPYIVSDGKKVQFSKLRVEEKLFCITSSYKGHFTGIAKSVLGFKTVQNLLQIEENVGV